MSWTSSTWSWFTIFQVVLFFMELTAGYFGDPVIIATNLRTISSWSLCIYFNILIIHSMSNSMELCLFIWKALPNKCNPQGLLHLRATFVLSKMIVYVHRVWLHKYHNYLLQIIILKGKMKDCLDNRELQNSYQTLHSQLCHKEVKYNPVIFLYYIKNKCYIKNEWMLYYKWMLLN